MRSPRIRLLPIVLAMIAAVALTGCGDDSDSAHAPAADGNDKQTEKASGPDITDATISVKLDGTDVPVEKIDCVRGAAGDGTYFNNASGTELSTLDVTFDDKDELANLTIYKGTEILLVWNDNQPNAADSDLTSTVDGDTYTVTGDTPNNADPGAKVAVEVTATCG